MRTIWRFKKITPELAYILGVYFGDGSITRRKSLNGKWIGLIFKHSSVDRDFVEDTASCLSILLKKTLIPVREERCLRGWNKRKMYYVTVQCNDLFWWMLNITENKNIIPNLIWEANENLKIEFLAGFMDSDGFITFEKRHPNVCMSGFCGWVNFIQQIKKLFQSLRIKVGKTVIDSRKNKYNGKGEFGNCFLNVQSLAESNFNFHLRRKQERLIKLRHLKNILPFNDYTSTTFHTGKDIV